jgi:Protein of unknown function (DUF1257)
MSHFLKIQTQIREREHLVQALRDLHYNCQVSQTQTNDLLVRGYQGNQERAEVVVDTGTQYDIGFQKRADNYEVVADWWGVERGGQIKQAQFIQQINRQYAYNIIRDQVREQNLIVEEERSLENGDVVITLSERG